MKPTLIFLFGTILLLSSCQPQKQAEAAPEPEAAPEESVAHKRGMIKVTVLYPNGEGKTFDMDYYQNKHFPLLDSLLGDALKGIAIEKGIAAAEPGQPVPYLAIGHLYFESIEAFQNSFGPQAAAIDADVPKYTNIVPQAVITEVVE